MKTITLIGHSGCKLEVEERGGGFIVIKTSKDAAYNPRLKAQHQKQKNFKEDIFRVPAVLAHGHDHNGLFQFSMEYIHGFTLAEYLKKADAASVTNIAQKFLTIIPADYAADPKAKAVFLAKLAELDKKIDTRKDKSLQKAFRQLEGHAWDYVMPGYCHGDMALENIIWKDGHLYLIDFLDSFYDSWMIDMGKLLFDIECLWSYRRDTKVDENLKTRFSVFRKIIVENILARKNGKELLRTIYHMSLLHILRILPYTTDEYTKKYLRDSVNKLHTIIDSL